jgi:pimeloyl-ACP methyl ester carboxylesterase
VIASRLAAAALVLAMSGSAAAQAPGARNFRGDLFLLSFDRWGDVVDPQERALIVRELRDNRAVRRLIVFSYGWSNDVEGSFRTYRQTLEQMTEGVPAEVRAPPGENVVIGVGWDASLTGFRKLFNDVIPFPSVADTLAFVPDKVLFPISFWSKAAMADRIGFGGLRTELNAILSEAYPNREDVPDIYLVGHSFGARVISALLKKSFRLIPVRSEAFRFDDRVRGVVLLQPALTQSNLPEEIDQFPILVTQSEHDHALGILFPIANLPVNAYFFTAFEALFREQVYGRVNEGFETAVETAGDVAKGTAAVVTRPLPGRRAEPAAEPPAPEPEADPVVFDRTRRMLVRSLAEATSLPLTLAFSLVAAPIGYLDTQLHSLATHPIEHAMDTLAQIPGVEVGVWGVGRLAGREIPWGRRGKGLFSLGRLHESIGRMRSPSALLSSMPGPVAIREIDPLPVAGSTCALPTCSGAFAVDAAEVIRTGSFGENLQQPFYDFSVGWLDLIGAHGDYLHPEAMVLIRATLARTPPASAAPTPPASE